MKIGAGDDVGTADGAENRPEPNTSVSVQLQMATWKPAKQITSSILEKSERRDIREVSGFHNVDTTGQSGSTCSRLTDTSSNVIKAELISSDKCESDVYRYKFTKNEVFSLNNTGKISSRSGTSLRSTVETQSDTENILVGAHRSGQPRSSGSSSVSSAGVCNNQYSVAQPRSRSSAVKRKSSTGRYILIRF